MTTTKLTARVCRVAGIFLLFGGTTLAADADLILYGGKIVTVNSAFAIFEAVAIKAGRITAVGRTADILAHERGAQTQMLDLKGQMVLPGLTDSHVHPLGAALSEYRESVPVLHNFAEIQKWIRQKAAATPKGQWIKVPKTFPTRLQEMRIPTRETLDVTTDHPVIYDASYSQVVNSYALKMSGITRDTPNPPGSTIEKDKNGEPNGILTRNAVALLKEVPREQFTDQEQVDALEKMLKRYTAAGLTAIGDRGVHEKELALYRKLKTEGRLPLRVVMTYRVSAEKAPVDRVVSEIRKAPYSTNQGDDWLKFGPFKVGLDGGMDAGTAYMREPYGPFQTQLFGISDPDNRGELFFSYPNLLEIMRAARDKGWAMAAHSQGGGAVDTLLKVFETLDKDHPIAPTRSHLIHASWMSAESIALCKKLGVLVDLQMDWLYFDGTALSKVMSPGAVRYFIPLRSLVDAGVIFAGGSDHMVGWDRNTAVNAYNPFLGMYTAITRKTIQGDVIHAEERIGRQDALKMYSAWPAYLYHSEKDRGSIEVGKLADLVVIDRDYLNCPEDKIKEITVLKTIIGGRIVYSSDDRDAPGRMAATVK
jgi:predicted amidohydrolase YtcJ